jgi:predicted metalloendopeptidase
MRKLLTIFAVSIAIVLAISSMGYRPGLAAKTEEETMSLPASDTSKLLGFDVANLDKSVSACSSFFQYANGGWTARNPVPPAFSRWGRFEMLDEGNLEVLRGILDSMVKRKALRRGTNEQKIADFYGSCMDEAGIEAEGAKPLQAEFDRIATINDVSGLQAEIARFHTYRIPAVFGFGAGQDFKNSQAVIAQAVQGGLGLPDRDYYTKDDDKSKQTREEYSKHVARMFELLGDSPERASEEGRTVLNIETKLAENASTRVQRRDPEANYHPMNRLQLSELTPHFDWRNYSMASVYALSIR